MTGSQLHVLAAFALTCTVLSEWSVVARTQHWPRFLQPLKNITVPEGREATFACHIANLGAHKVAWIKSENQGVLSINDKVISDHARLSVVRNDVNTWTMTLRGVRRDDSGSYMCQVNTSPVQVQVGVLEVVVPPDIETSATSADIDVPEGGSARLECRAKGHPPPIVSWHREDGRDIALRHDRQLRGSSFTGEVLHLAKVSRSDMGVYLCIASNNIPPPVSKRIMVSVHFEPSVSAVNGLIGAPLGSNVTMTCHVEASPKPIYYWAAHNGDMLLSRARYRIANRQLSDYRHQMSLRISDVTAADFRPYLCVAKNAVGEAADRVDLHEMAVPVRTAEERRWQQQQQQQKQRRRRPQDRRQQQQEQSGPSRRRGARLPTSSPSAASDQQTDRVAAGCLPGPALLLLVLTLGAGRLH